MPGGPASAGGWSCDLRQGERKFKEDREKDKRRATRRSEEGEKEEGKEDLVTMVCGAPLATVLSALQT